jgi:SAM-dependent methyltransferase
VTAVDVRAFARANLPAPPARVLEVGAGSGDLARALEAAGYSVVAIDPEPGGVNVVPVALHDLGESAGSFDAAIAVVSLHHIDPLEASCRRLAEVLRADASLLVDEFDVSALDERAAAWWLEQRQALGSPEEATAAEVVKRMRAELHPVREIVEALRPYFEIGPPLRGGYLYRWGLDESLRPAEEELIAQGNLPAVGARLLARRRSCSRSRSGG